MSQVRHRSEIPPQKSEKMRYPQRISKMAIILRTSLSWLSLVFRKGLLMSQERDRRGETRASLAFLAELLSSKYETNRHGVLDGANNFLYKPLKTRHCEEEELCIENF
ncbi:hypothetical protein TNIN_469511 [Trichonephila inaurata madagascariensis]|uniref:Uncharacterized protein n=1 Tax=Trichonephila inaurata madagascariensis TaxID=2747483 RepID=A0A8X7C699_9ARAC|nr:hypothetical protein TNIN_469511 [Trichonephila inaurata madagascariensis]